jgi:hypothetical protein
MRLLFLLTFLSFNLFAEDSWTLIHKDEHKKSSFYIKLGDFKKIDNKVRLWVMESFDEPQPPEKYAYHSLKSLVQADCSGTKIRFMAYSIYKSNNATGKAIYTKGKSSEWFEAKINTVNRAYFDIACKESN